MLKIGTGSGWWGDRISPAVELAEKGDLDYLCFETMAEATVSTAQVRKRRDPDFGGFDTYLDDRMAAVLPHCIRRGTRIVSNQGWVNPVGAARAIRAHLDRLGAHHWKVAAVTGSIVSDRIAELAGPIMETGREFDSIEGEIVSAEAYLGAAGIVQALADGADIVVTGRVADPALFLAPMMHEFGWRADDWDRLGAGAGIGHLMECGAQLTGGYFVDPGYKDVPEPWNLGFPIAEVEADGAVVFGKLPDTGGVIDRHTVLEQMFYEVHDPARYITPDVVVDFTGARIEPMGLNRVRVTGITGTPRTDTLKVSIGAQEGFIGEDLFVYAGPGALDKAYLAERILRERFRIVGLQASDLRFDFIGVNAVHGPMSPVPATPPYEVAVRVAARCRTRAEALKIGREVDGMAVSGIGSTGKRVPFAERVREVIGIWSTLIDRDQVSPQVQFIEAGS
ncbi:acyclic terpene utilization AtuA family protein [Salinisphaera sp. T31B1]|uniref:acyclic terpene utilization AtuA family protein n=1 Tax=Salinisphaera sp. T31B1 TaxID=727963 RepID=UPI00333E5A7F